MLSLVVIAIMVRMAALGNSRMVLAVAIAIPILALAASNMRAAIIAAIVYVVIMGDLRRMLISFGGWSQTDPLLLLGTGFAVVFAGYAVATRSIKLDSSLSKWIAVLMAVMVIQMFNPRQGGLVVGVAGALFLMAPLVWYWVGKAYMTPRLLRFLLYAVVVPLGIGAMLFGFYQNAVGYLPYQMEWYHVAGYTALGNLTTGLAPISFFSSRTEHAVFLVIGAVVLWAAFLKGRRAVLILIVLFFIAVVLNGSRGPMVKVLGTGAVMWAFMGSTWRMWVPRGLLAVLVCGVGLFWSLTFASTLELDQRFQADLNRQARLFSSEETTLDTHSSLLIGGYLAALRQPLGYGLGMPTKAAAKFGGGGFGTETDIGDVMISLGLVGGFVYHIVIGLVLFTAAMYWRRSRSMLALAILGILIATIFSWLRGGMYAISPIIWLCVGALDRFSIAYKAQTDLTLEPKQPGDSFTSAPL